MDYEKMYKEALERAREYWETDNDNTLDIKAKGTMEYLFPELAESEDERIRKHLIDCVTRTIPEADAFKEISKEQILTWLEKQGEQKPFDYENVTIVQKDFSPKEEPKFKVGDWVFSSALGTAHIIGVNDDKYQLEYIDGKQEFSSIDYVNYIYVKWSIEKAKPGDVLYSFMKSLLWIYKDGEDCYFAINPSQSNTISIGVDFDALSDAKPATQEQRDLLFQKIHKFGYEWDAENKELKKIEEEPQLKEGNFYECIKSYHHLCGNEYWFVEGKVYFCEKDGYLRSDHNNLIKVYDCKNWQSYFRPYTGKPGWSKEDIDYYDAIIAKLEVTQEDAALTDNQMKFLKSLKDRIVPQTQQDWSEEDESMYVRTLGILGKCYMGELPTKVEEELNWFKSIKNRIGG